MQMKQRILTGIIAGILFFSVLFYGGAAYMGLLLLLALIGFDEFVRMARIPRFSVASMIGHLLILLWFGYGFDYLSIPAGERETFLIGLLWFAVALWLLLTVTTKNKLPLKQVSSLFLAAFYIAVGFYYIAETRLIENGLEWTFFIFLCTWASDTGAYFTGRWMGKRKLWPSISPNKTIEGSLGGILWSIVIGLAFAFSMPELVSLLKAIVLSVVIAVVGQIGDLVESAYKRHYDTKDSGVLLPGHGGILDRTDSWILAFPFVHLTQLLSLSF
jgi:phosphatidate cytidylyltransferase